jgi:hypothetical protein
VVEMSWHLPAARRKVLLPHSMPLDRVEKREITDSPVAYMVISQGAVTFTS